VRSRIRLISSGAVVAFALATALFNGAPGAIATQGQPVVAGQDNTETNETLVQNTNVSVFGCGTYLLNGFVACGQTGVSGYGTQQGTTGYGPHGVVGTGSGSGSTVGVLGTGTTGVKGVSSTGYGVYGTTEAASVPGLYGTNTAGGDAIQGVTTGAQASAVYGHNTSGGGSVAKGVFGSATGGGTGVRGESASGHGVEGVSSTGTGVYASGAMGLQVVGKARFSRSGITTISAGATSKTISLAGVTTASMVLATSQQNSTVFVRSAVPASGAFTIRLSGAAPTGGLKVAYFVLN
jgi:hypothetical protein